MSEKLYCPECGEYLMAGDGECHDCHCGWTQYKPADESLVSFYTFPEPPK